MKRIALSLLVLLPALALAGSGPSDLGRRIVHRVAFECRLFEVRPGKAAEVPDGLPFSAKSRAGFKRGTIAADDLRTFFDGSFETLEGVTLAWSGAFSATQISPARASVPLPGPDAPDRTLELVLSASYLSYFDAGGPSARFGVGFVFRTAGTEDGAPAAVPPSVHDWVPSGAGFGAVLRESSGPDDPELLLVIGNWRHDGHVIVPARAAALPAAPSPAADAHGSDAVHPEIRIDALVLQIGSPTNRESATDWYYRVLLGADPALFPEADRPAVACYRGTLDAARAAAASDGNAYLLGMTRVVFRDGCKAEVSLLDIDGEPGKPAVTNGVRLSVRPIVCRGGTPLLRLTAEASVFAGDDTAESEELGLALEPGAAAVFAPPPAGDCRVLVLLFPDDSWSHAADTPSPAEPEPHAESAENAEPDPHAEPAWGDAMYFLDLLEWQKRNPDAFAAALAALAKDFATNAPVAEEMQ